MPVLVVIFLVLLISLFCFLFCFYQTKKQKANIPDFPETDQYSPYKKEMFHLYNVFEKAPFEEITIKSRDKLTLYGRLYKGKEEKTVDIMFHGYRSTAYRDFCGGYKLSKKRGNNVILVDQRAHGKSGGRVITFGIKEKYDVLSWVNYAITRFGEDVKINLIGVSMGAAPVLSALDLDLPKNVSGVIADCPYSSPARIIKKVSKDMKIPSLLSYPFIFLGAMLYGGFIIRGGAEKAAEKAKIPVLIIHGKADRFVPHSMSEDIYKRLKVKKKLLSVEEAGHGVSYFVSPENYEKAIDEYYEMI